MVRRSRRRSARRLPRSLRRGRLFVRVIAAGGGGGTGRGVGVGPAADPPWSTVTSPTLPAGMVIDTAQPTLTWKPVRVSSPPGPLVFDLDVQRVATGVTDFNVANLTDSSFALTRPLERNTAYRWFLTVHAGPDTSTVRSQGSFLIVDLGMPTSTLLYQNFPNPFPAAGRDSTCLWFDLALAGSVELDTLGLRSHLLRRFVPGPDFPGVLAPRRSGRASGSGG